MTLTLAAVIEGVRDLHPAFHRVRVPNGVLARQLADRQLELLGELIELDPQAVTAQASLLLALQAENAQAVVGAGTSGGLPGVISGQSFGVAEVPTGDLLDLDFSVGVLVAETILTGASATTAVKTGAGWVVNAYANTYARIPHGPAKGQRRKIVSNTSDTLTLSQPWTVIPTAGLDLLEIVAATIRQADGVTVVTEFPAVTDRIGYLLRLDAAGLPYFDLTKPLTATVGVGVPLPPHFLVTGGTVREAQGGTRDLEIVAYQDRLHVDAPYAAWIEGGQLWLVGGAGDWNGVQSLDLRYVPIPSEFTALTDLFLLPDYAKPVLVAQGGYLAAMRVAGTEKDLKINPDAFLGGATAAHDRFLAAVGRQRRAVVTSIRQVW